MSRYKSNRAALTAINEGDEYCTLQDVLNSRGSWLRQEELWAVCRECCLTLQSVSNSTEIVQGLCVMLETLAFDSFGHVCFTDQDIERDPHYTPPEYEEVGNSSKGHVYSLGMLMNEASAYNSTASKIPEHSARLRKLLSSMMDSEYSDRITPEAVIKECDTFFRSSGVSSHDICRKMTASVSQRTSESGSVEELRATPQSEAREVEPIPLTSVISEESSPPSTEMSLQGLVEKYTPERLKVILSRYARDCNSLANIHSSAEAERLSSTKSSLLTSTPEMNIDGTEATNLTDVSMLSPPSGFGASSSSSSSSSGSAFISKDGLSKRERVSLDEVDEERVLAEGATLKAGNAPLRLPEAYRSDATHFSPIVLANHKSSPPKAAPREQKTNRNLKELKKQLLKHHSTHDTDSPRSSHSQPSSGVKPSTPNKPTTQTTPMSRERGVSLPVTQAVRPLPRKTENSDSAVGSHSTVTTSFVTGTTSTFSTVGGVQSNPTTLVVNSPAITSTAVIPSYPSMPVMLQRDPATGAVGWLPVVPNMPYWPVSQPINNQPALQQDTTAGSPAVTQEPVQTVDQRPAVTSNSQATPNDSQLTDTNTPTTPAVTVSGVVSGEKTTPIVTPMRSKEESAPVKEETSRKVSAVSPGKRSSEKTSKVAKEKRPKGSGKSHHKLLMLTQIRQRLKNEFAFDGYMTHGQEDVEMAEFIGSLQLPALDFTNWCNIIVAKYGDLYWSEELLVSLYEVIHGQKPNIDRPPSGALRAKSARVLSVDEPGTTSTTQSVSQRFSQSPFRPISQDISTVSTDCSLGVSTASSTPRKVKRSLLKPKALMPHPPQKDGSMTDVSSPHSPLSFSLTRLKSASVTELSPGSLAEEDLTRQYSNPPPGMVKSKSQSLLDGNMESRAMTPLVKSLILPNGGTRDVMYVEGKQANPLFDDMITNRMTSTTSAFEQESDSHSHSSASELRVKGRLHNYNLSSSVGGDDVGDSAFGSRLSSEYDSDVSIPSLSMQTSSQNKICATLAYATYLNENSEAVSLLSEKSENKSVDGVKKKLADLTQQIAINVKRRNKAAKYAKKIVDSSSKGLGDHKAIFPKVKAEYRDAVMQLYSLDHAKLKLEVLLAEQSSVDVACLFSFTKPSRPLLVIETKENPRLQLQMHMDLRTNVEKEVIYAGEPYGLLSYLYAKGALEDGYILDFFHSYRYFLAAKDIMAFICEKYNAAKELKPCEIRTKVMKRSLDLLTFWVTCYYSVDFILAPTVVDTLVNFLQDEVLSEHQAECEPLLRMLDDFENDKSKNSSFFNPIPGTPTELPPYTDEDGGSHTKKWNSSQSMLTIASGRNSVQYIRTNQGLALHKNSGKKHASQPSAVLGAEAFSVMDYKANELAEQLTLIDQAFFRDIHPVNFMNTLAQGISASLAGSAVGVIPVHEKKPLFHSDYVQLVAVPAMIQHSKKLAYWVTAEVLSATSSKVQTSMVNKFLQTAKICKDLGNFATAMSIKDGLDHPLLRLIPAWKEAPPKLVQEIEDMKLSLKTDSSAVRPPEEVLGLPTIPCALLFSLHVQQLEQGGFTLANGMYRWPKLRSLARLVDTIRLCKNYAYKFVDNVELGELLNQRIRKMNSDNLESLAMTSGADSSRGGSTGVSHRWSNVFKKVKGKFK